MSGLPTLTWWTFKKGAKHQAVPSVSLVAEKPEGSQSRSSVILNSWVWSQEDWFFLEPIISWITTGSLFKGIVWGESVVLFWENSTILFFEIKGSNLSTTYYITTTKLFWWTIGLLFRKRCSSSSWLTKFCGYKRGHLLSKETSFDLLTILYDTIHDNNSTLIQICSTHILCTDEKTLYYIDDVVFSL